LVGWVSGRHLASKTMRQFSGILLEICAADLSAVLIGSDTEMVAPKRQR